MTLLALTVLAAFALYVLKPVERLRLLNGAIAVARLVVRRVAQHASDRDEFEEALRARTRWPLIVPALLASNTLVFVAMLLGPDSLSDPATLIAWGANFGPRTTNVEWGRIIQSTFVHAGVLHLLATMAGLAQAGLVMERLVGYLTFSAVYLICALFANVVSLWLHPMGVSVGASGAVFGIYGFLAAASIWGIHRPSGIAIPFRTVKTFAPAAAVFLLYNVFLPGLPFEAELAGFAAGFAAGLVLTRDLGERKPAPRLAAAAVAVTFTIAAGIALPLHGLTDIRPELQWIIRLEDGTAARYRTAVERFRKGLITAPELADIIQRTIVPELQSARTRLTALGRVPQEHQPLLARADEFLRLRNESWRIRADALQEGDMAVLREADQMEMTSLQALEQIRPAMSP